MNTAAERYAQLHEILGRAKDLQGDELDAYLQSACHGDRVLVHEVVELIAAGRNDSDDAFADDHIGQVRSALEMVADDAAPAWLPDRIGDYTIVRQIGVGGMGVVYEAEQASPHRRVAIKLLHPMHATPERLHRFRQEAELLGRLHHPGIAQIFEAGTYDAGRGSQPFFAMELVEGTDIASHCEQEGLSRLARLQLLARVADAVEAAHEQGVIHRDLKPDNVLVDQHGQPRVLDFGIARARSQSATLSTLVTEEGQLLGTLAYMAPEQLNHEEHAVTTQVDIYALGVLGFEILLGRLPHAVEGLSISKTIAVLTTRDAPRASSYDPSLRGDVETILGKALESDRTRRYLRAADLAADLRLHLSHQPILARPPSRAYIVRKFARRHRGLVAGLALACVVALIGTGVARHYWNSAEERAMALERSSYTSGLAAASRAVQQGQFAAASSDLDRLPADHRGWEYDYLRARLSHHTTAWETPAPLKSDPVFHHKGSRMSAVMADGSLGTWDASSGVLLATLPFPDVAGGVNRRKVKLTGSSGRFAAVGIDGSVLIGSLEDGEVSAVLDGAGDLATETTQIYAWNATGEHLLYWADGLYVWDGSASRQIHGDWNTHGAWAAHGAFNRAGDMVVIGLVGAVSLIDVATGKLLTQVDLDDAVTALEFSPDDQTLAVACEYRTIFLLDAPTLKTRARLAGHSGLVTGLAWNTDGSSFATHGDDGTLRLWNPETLAAQTVYVSGTTAEVGVVEMPSGDWLLPAGPGVHVFPVENPYVLRGHASYVYRLAFSPDGSMLASSGFLDPVIHIWETRTFGSRWQLTAPVTLSPRAQADADSFPRIEFSADSRRLVAWTNHGAVHYQLSDGRTMPVADGNGSGDPRDWLDRALRTLGRRKPALDQDQRARSPDGTRLALTKPDGTIELYDVTACTPEAGGLPADDIVEPVIAIDNGTARLIHTLTGHIGYVYCAAFSPDGKRLATGGNDMTVRLWDVETFEQVLMLQGHENYVMDVAFSPDGTLLASASGDRTVRLWDTVPLAERRAGGSGH